MGAARTRWAIARGFGPVYCGEREAGRRREAERGWAGYGMGFQRGGTGQAETDRERRSKQSWARNERGRTGPLGAEMKEGEFSKFSFLLFLFQNHFQILFESKFQLV